MELPDTKKTSCVREEAAVAQRMAEDADLRIRVGWRCASLSSGLPGKGSLWRRGQGRVGSGSKAEQSRAGGEATREAGRRRTANLWATGEQWEEKRISKSLPPAASLKDNRSLEHQLLHFCFHGSTSLRAATPSVSTGCPEAARPGFLEPPARAQLAQRTRPLCSHGTARAGSETSPESCHSKQRLKLWRPFPNDRFQRLEKQKENKSTTVFQN